MRYRRYYQPWNKPGCVFCKNAADYTREMFGKQLPVCLRHAIMPKENLEMDIFQKKMAEGDLV